MSQLSEQEVERAHEVFRSFDKHSMGRVKLFELSKMLEAAGVSLSAPEVAACRDSVDDEGTRQIRVEQFLALLSQHKQNRQQSESDLLGAFVACGGKEDGTGEVNAETMAGVIEDFGLNIDLAYLKESVAMDPNTEVGYDKFQLLVNANQR
jgi:calmodulin